MLWAQKEEVPKVLKGPGSRSTRIMVRLGAFLFTAFDSGSKVLTKCTSLKGGKRERNLFLKPGKGALKCGARKVLKKSLLYATSRTI